MRPAIRAPCSTGTWTPSCRQSSSEWRPSRGPALPELRAASSADLPALLAVFHEAAEDLDRRRGRPVHPRNPAPLEQHLRHFLATDPASAYVADDHGRAVGFGISYTREGDGFLSFLFVLPEWQAQGLGQDLLRACLDGAGPVARMATCAEADQPVSTGLYGSLGWAPRLPLYLVRGALAEGALPPLAEGVRGRPVDPPRVAALDRALLGYSRPGDHAFWAATERQGWIFEDAGGELLGYGYAQRSGRIGPVAAAEEAHLPSFIGHLVRSTSVLEGWQLIVPGPAIAALAPLLRGGLRIDGTPAIYCADHAGPAFDRYLPMSYALL